MGSSPKTATRPDEAQRMASNPTPVPFQPAPGGEPPPWQSILPTGGGPAQLGDKVRMERPASSFPSAPASTPPNAGAATSAASNVSAAVQNLPPELQRQYLAAKAAGNEALAAQILLSGSVSGGGPVGLNQDRGYDNAGGWGGEHASGG